MGHEPYGHWHYATQPSRGTLFWRTFLPWQLLRFAVVNLLMIKMIFKSHGRRIPR